MALNGGITEFVIFAKYIYSIRRQFFVKLNNVELV